MEIKIKINFLFCIIAFIFFYGCSNYQAQLKQFDKDYYKNNPQKAYQLSLKLSKNDLLWEIQNGIAGYTISNYENSLKILNIAENKINKNYNVNIASNTAKNIGATLLNDNIKTYKGNIYEGVLINYYKALNALEMGNYALARVEFNRANDRQRRAKDYYQKEIQKAIQQDKKEAGRGNQSLINSNTSEEKINYILNKQYSNLSKFKTYSGFINPSVSYVSGLFFGLAGDSKSIDLLKESYGINHSDIIGEDLLIFQNKQYLKQHYTWIIIEDGKNATKEEIRIDFPIILINGGFYTFSMALPQLRDGVSFYRSFSLLQDQNYKSFEEITNLDGVIANEFEKQLPYIIARSIIGAVLKVGLQVAMDKGLGNFGSLGSLAASIFTIATTSADTRSTTVFPHKIWLYRIKNTDGIFKILGDARLLKTFEFSDCLAKMKNTENSNKTIDKNEKICKNTNNVIYVRTTKDNVVSKILIGE